MENSSRADPAPALFLCLFAVQASVIALSPVLAEVAADFDVSTATAGQLRSVSGLVAGFTAVAMGRLSGRLGLRELLLAGLAVLAAGSLLSAAAPAFAVLAAAQAAVGAGLAMVLSAGLAAAAEWSLPEQRARVLSWALLGQPFAWIVGMPTIGLLGGLSWRWGWLAVPFLASALAFAAVARRPADGRREPPVGAWGLLRRDRRVAGWALGELFAWSAWAGTLVFAGALFVESYGASTATAGFLLGLAAVAYLPGNMLARRHVEGSARLLAAELTADHVKCFTLNSLIGPNGGPQAVEAVLASRFGWRARLPQRPEQIGLELIGARPCLYGQGRIAHIMYRHHGHPVSVFMLPDTVRPDQFVEVMGHEAVIWTEHGRTFVLLASEPRPQVERMASFVEASLR